MSAATKHTARPWAAKDAGVVALNANGANVICEAPIHYLESSKNWPANSRLIAAAPDLLEVAQAAWNCIGELTPTQARVEVAQMLQAAIERATGAAL